MRKLATLVTLLVAGLLAPGFLMACDGGSGTSGTIKGSGNPATQQKDFSDFARIDASSAFSVEIVRSSSYSVSITVDDNLIQYINVSKSGDTLNLSIASGSYSFTSLKAEITMPELRKLKLSGACHATIEGFSSSQDLVVDLSGASRATGDMEAGDAEFKISEASSVELDGSAVDIVVDASGASHAELGGFQVTNADVRLSGASEGTVKLDGTLDADLSGASHLGYIGNPQMGNINTSDSSTLAKEG